METTSHSHLTPHSIPLKFPSLDLMNNVINRWNLQANCKIAQLHCLQLLAKSPGISDKAIWGGVPIHPPFPLYIDVTAKRPVNSLREDWGLFPAKCFTWYSALFPPNRHKLNTPNYFLLMWTPLVRRHLSTTFHCLYFSHHITQLHLTNLWWTLWLVTINSGLEIHNSYENRLTWFDLFCI